MNSIQAMHNQDLVWELHQTKQHDQAKDFIRFFENKLCVFSPSVNKIYTNYNFFFPEDMKRQMIVLPNRYAFHDTISHVSKDAITPTGLHIIPGSLINKKGPYLIISHSDEKVKSLPIPFREGIKLIMNRLNTDNPFLPVLTKGDLRQFNDSIPSLHLNRLSLKKLTSLSQFEQQDVKKAISKSLAKLYVESSKLMI